LGRKLLKRRGVRGGGGKEGHGWATVPKREKRNKKFGRRTQKKKKNLRRCELKYLEWGKEEKEKIAGRSALCGGEKKRSGVQPAWGNS